MARVVGSVGDYLIFDGHDEAIAYLKDSDCLIFKSNEDAKEYVNNELDCIVYDNEADMSEHLEESYGVGAIFSQEKIVDWCQQEYTVDDVFDSSDITQYVAETCDVGDVFDEDSIVEWVRENCAVADVFDEEEIAKTYKEQRKQTKTGKEVITEIVENVFAERKEFLKLKEFYEDWKHIEEVDADGDEKHYVVSARIHKANLFEREHLFFENKALKEENEELKAKVARMERSDSDLHLLKNIFSDLIFSNRTAKDGQVWKFNSDTGNGEWC